MLKDHLQSLKADRSTTLTNTIFATSNAANMHLSTVHQSSYYSGPSTSAANMTSSPCFNMTIGSRIMRHCRPCTNATSLFASPSSTHLFARNIDDRQSQGTHTMATVGIIIGVIIGCLCVAAIWGWAVKSNKKAFVKSQNRRGRVVRHGNGYGGSSEKHDMETDKHSHAYQGDGGLAAPLRSARSNGTRFPVRSSHARSGRSNQSRGPYADGNPFSAVAGFEEGGSQGRGRYNNTRGSSRHS